MNTDFPQAQMLQHAQAHNKAMDLYDIHRQAVATWHDACQQFAIAEKRRDQAKAELDKISQDFAQLLTASMNDPTLPGASPQTAMPMNGQAFGIGGSAR